MTLADIVIYDIKVRMNRPSVVLSILYLEL